MIDISERNACKPFQWQMGGVAVKKCMQLAAASLMLVLVWLVLLPKLSALSPFREHIEAMRASDIHVDAMFYSELEHVPGL